MEIITAKTNKRVAFIRSLLEKSKERKKHNSFVIEGIKMVNEALSLGLLDEVFLSESLAKSLDTNEFTGSLKEEISILKHFISSGNKATVLSDALFQYVSETVTPQGALAIVKMPRYEIEEVLKQKDRIRLLVLENLGDPGNLGTIMRTAEAAGITAVIMSSETVNLFNPKVVRATMGSIFRLPFIITKDLEGTILNLKKSGIHFYAAHLKGEKDYKETSYHEKAGLLIGNEAKGLSDKIAELSDTYIKIPMKGKVESLNAAIAAAIIMYEMM